MLRLVTPLSQDQINNLKVLDNITISGRILTGRDVVLPKLVRIIENNGFKDLKLSLEGSVIFHTAVSPAGIGPTSSNKVDIESSIPALSKAGVKIHLGKGSLSRATVQALKEHGSLFAITPPVSALFGAKVRKQRAIAFLEEGMEALHELEVVDFPAIIAIAHGQSIFDQGGDRHEYLI
ncbi:MAG: fumarate hydratase C-terminal domain-containing protein [Bacillota bacterium]